MPSPFQRAMARAKRRSKSSRSNAFAIVATLIVAGTVMTSAYFVYRGPRSKICDLVDEESKRPLTITIYTDLQCPYCASLDRALRPFRDSPALRLVVRHYPLDRECNPRMRKSRHPGACLQARAAICAEGQGEGDTLRARLFESGVRDRAGVLEVAGSLGLEPQRFERCLASENTDEQLRRNVDDALASGVQGTPTLFVGGSKRVGMLTQEDLGCLSRFTESVE